MKTDPLEELLRQKHLEDVEISIPIIRPSKKGRDPELNRKLDQAIAELLAEREEAEDINK